MTEEEFYSCSVRFFFLKWAGYNELESERRQNAWNIARWQTAYLLSPYSKKRINPTDLAKFEWDERPPQTKEDWIKQNAELYKLANKIAEA